MSAIGPGAVDDTTRPRKREASSADPFLHANLKVAHKSKRSEQEQIDFLWSV